MNNFFDSLSPEEFASLVADTPTPAPAPTVEQPTEQSAGVQVVWNDQITQQEQPTRPQDIAIDGSITAAMTQRGPMTGSLTAAIDEAAPVTELTMDEADRLLATNRALTSNIDPKIAGKLYDLQKLGSPVGPLGSMDAVPEDVKEIQRKIMLDMSPAPVSIQKYYADPGRAAIMRDQEKPMTDMAAILERATKDPVGVIDDYLTQAGAAFDREKAMVKYGRLLSRKWVGGEDISQEELDKAKFEMTRATNLAAYLEDKTGTAGYVLSEGVGVASQVLEGGLQAVAPAFVGAGLGAAAGFAAAGGPVGAVPGAVKGGVTGLSVGYIMNSFDIEAGLAAEELSDLTDVNGNKLPDSYVKAGAIVAGALNATLEYAGTLATLGLAKAAPGAMKAVQSATRKTINQGVRAALMNSKTAEAILKSAARFTGAVTFDMLTEIAQEVVPYVTGEVAKDVAEGQRGQVFTSPVGELSARVQGIIPKVAAGSFGFGLLPFSIGMARTIRQANRTTTLVNTVTELNQKVHESDMLNRSEEATVDAVAYLQQEIPGLENNLYMDPAELIDLADDSTWKALNKMGITQELANEALDKGESIQFGLPELVARLKPENLSKIRDSLRSDPAGPSLADMRNINFEEAVNEAISLYDPVATFDSETTDELARITEAVKGFYTEQFRDTGKGYAQRAEGVATATQTIVHRYARYLRAMVGAEEARNYLKNINIESVTAAVADEVARQSQGLAQVKQNLSEITPAFENRGLAVDVTENDSSITLSKVVVPEEARGVGVGSEFMTSLVTYADQTGKMIDLTPSLDYGASSKKRLVSFYKRFGFVENKGKNRNYATREDMYRDPKSQTANQFQPSMIENTQSFKLPWDTVLVTQNPSAAELQAMKDEMQAVYPGSREPATRITKDSFGNIYAWRSDQGDHRTMEPLIKQRWGVEVGQNIKPVAQSQFQLPPAAYDTLGQAKTDSPEFKAWFGDSKVVDAEGKPLVVYHGTGSEFEAFVPKKIQPKSKMVLDIGIHFGEKRIAQTYAESAKAPGIRKRMASGDTGMNPTVVPVYLSLKNPLTIERGKSLPEDISEALIELAQVGPKSKAVQLKDVDPMLLVEKAAGKDNTRLLDVFTSRGYDGIKYYLPGMAAKNNFVAFSPTQIKSVNNRGTFSPTDANIYMQDAQEEAQKRVIKPKGYYQPAEHMISLVQGRADVSTIIHELSHDFLKTMGDLATRSDANEALTKDWARIKEWLGAESDELTTEQQEKFARGFEAYTMVPWKREKGQPKRVKPPKEVYNALERFRRYLTQIYKSVKPLEMGQMTPDIVDFFDRLLSIDSQTEAVSAETGMGPIENDVATALNLSSTDRTRLDNLAERARDKTVKKANKAIERAKRKKATEFRKIAEAEVKTLPISITRATMTESGIDPQTLDIALPDKVVVTDPATGEQTEMTASEVRKKIKWGIKKEGFTPQDIAIDAGYPSPLDMIQDLMVQPSKNELIQQRVDEAMRAWEATVNPADYYIDLPEMEQYRTAMSYFLGKAAGAPRNAMQKAVLAEAAERASMQGTTRDAINVSRAYQEYIKALKNEKDALVKGDLAQALYHNNQAIYLYEKLRNAKKNRDKVQRMLKQSKRILKTKKVSVPAEYHSRLIDTISRWQLANVPRNWTLPADTPSIASLLSVNHDDEFNPQAPFSEEALTGHGNWKRKSMSTLSEVMDIIDALIGTGREVNNNDLFKGKVKLLDAQEMVDADLKSLPNLSIYKKGTMREKVIREWRSYDADRTMSQYLARAINGYKEDGAGVDLLLRPLNEAYAKKVEYQERVFEKLEPALKKLRESSKNFPKAIDTGVPIPEIMANSGRDWDFERILALALNMGTAYNRNAALEGYALTQQQADDIMRILTDEDWKAVQEIWDSLEVMWPEMRRVYKAVNHVEPPRQKAEPYVTPSGAMVRGGYYPCKYDPELSRSAGEWTRKDDLFNSTNAAFLYPATRSGHMISRTGSGGRPVLLSLIVLGDHVDYATSYAAYTETLRDIHRVFSPIGKDLIKTALKEGRTPPNAADSVARKLGEPMLQEITRLLRHVARGSKDPGTAIDRVINTFRNLSAVSILGANIGPMAKQALSLPGAWWEAGVGTWYKGMKHCVFNVTEAYAQASEKSAYMRTRYKNMDREVGDLLSQFSFSKTKIEQLREMAMAGLLFVDALTVMPIWHGKYVDALAKTGDINEAVLAADRLIQDTQPSSRPMDLAHFQRHTTGLHRLFTMFQTMTMKYGNRQAYVWNAMRSGNITPFAAVKWYFLETMLPAFASTFIGAAIRGRLGELEPEDFGWDLVMFNFSGLPFIRDLFEIVVYNFGKAAGSKKFKRMGVRPSPALKFQDVLADTIAAPAEWIMDMDDDKKFRKAAWTMAEGISFATGIPIANIARELKPFVEDNK